MRTTGRSPRSRPPRPADADRPATAREPRSPPPPRGRLRSRLPPADARRGPPAARAALRRLRPRRFRSAPGPCPARSQETMWTSMCPLAREVPLAGAPGCLVRGILRVDRRRQRERSVRVRVRPVGRTVVPEALGQPDKLLELRLRDGWRGVARGEQVLAGLLGACRGGPRRDGEVPPAVARVIDRIGERRVPVGPVTGDDRHGLVVRCGAPRLRSGGGRAAAAPQPASSRRGGSQQDAGREKRRLRPAASIWVMVVPFGSWDTRCGSRFVAVSRTIGIDCRDSERRSGGGARIAERSEPGSPFLAAPLPRQRVESAEQGLLCAVPARHEGLP